MKLNTLMIITAIVAVIFGLGFILAPASVMKLYGVDLNLGSQFMGRYLGAAFIGLAFLAWLNRNAASKGVQQGFFVTALLGFVVAIYDKVAGTGSAMVWVNLIIFLLLAIGFGYFAYMKKD